MFLIFIILSLLLSSAIFFIKNKRTVPVALSIYSVALLGISFYSYFNLNKIDSVYYKFDAMGVILTFILSLLSIATFYHSSLYLKRKDDPKKRETIYYASLVLFITAMISTYFTENLALLWVSIEATSLFVAILIFHIRSKDALEATWKYLFISSVGLAIAFIGVLFLSITASKNGIGSLSFDKLLAVAPIIDTYWVKIAFVMTIAGFSVKMNIFPLYAVAVDAKTIAASPVNALMSTALVNVGFVGIYRIYGIVAKTDAIDWAQNLLMLVGVVSIFIAAIQLTRVKRLKRLFAFSSMEHMGLVLIGLAAGGLGYYAAILHLIFHSFVKSSLFYQLGATRRYFKSIWICDSGNYFRLNPVGALAFIFGIISILAIPPSGLFISEFLIFKALFINGNYFIMVFALILLTSIIYTMIKLSLRLLYYQIPVEKINSNVKENKYENISQFIFLALVVYLGINPPQFFTDLINSAISVLN